MKRFLCLAAGALLAITEGVTAGPPAGAESLPPPWAVSPYNCSHPAPVEWPQGCTQCTLAECQEGGTGWRLWASAEYLYWWIKGDDAPPLVTTGPATAPRPIVGTLGQPTTAVLAGGDRTDYGLFPGFRLRGGFWFNEAQTCGVEGSFSYLGRGSDSATFQSSGNPPLLRPFFNTLTGLPDTELVALPGVLSGSVSVDPRFIDLIGGDVNFRGNLCCDCAGRHGLSMPSRSLRRTATRKRRRRARRRSAAVRCIQQHGQHAHQRRRSSVDRRQAVCVRVCICTRP